MKFRTPFGHDDDDAQPSRRCEKFEKQVKFRLNNSLIEVRPEELFIYPPAAARVWQIQSPKRKPAPFRPLMDGCGHLLKTSLFGFPLTYCALSLSVSARV